jgi:hypothetical protein
MHAALHFDEGYATAFGERLLDGHLLPYVDAFSHRGPLLYWSAALAQWLGGRFEWNGVRYLILTVFVASTVALFLAGIATRRVLAGAVGALLFVYINVCILETESVFGLLAEPIGNPFAIASLTFTAWALHRSESVRARLFLLALGGAMAAVSALAKQTYLPLIGPYVLWVAAFAWSREELSTRARIEHLAAPILGWLMPLAAVVLIYASAGKLRAFFYWYVTYNRDIYMDPYRDAKTFEILRDWARDQGILVIALLALLVNAFAQVAQRVAGPARGFAARYFHAGFQCTVALQVLLTVIGSLAPLRFFAHYYLPPVPWVAILVGIALEQSVDSSPVLSETRRKVGYLGVALLLGAFSTLMLNTQLKRWKSLRAQGAWADARPEPICAIVHKYAGPKDPIFVWGFDGDLYITCQRHPASGFLHTTMVAGVVPPFWRDERPERIALNARETLISELTERRPPVILDSPDRSRGFSITLIPLFKNYLEGRYCFNQQTRAKDGRSIGVWIRKDLCPHS